MQTGGIIMKSDVAVGILTLDMVPERVGIEENTPGNLSSDETFDFRLKREIVRGATDGSPWAEGGMTVSFIEAAKKLEARGVKAIAGDCGYMVKYQRDVARAVSVPVVNSSLLLVPLVYRMLAENQRVGILTSAFHHELAEKYFNAAGWSSKDIPVALKGFKSAMDLIPTEDIVELAKELIKEYPDIGAFVLECSVIPPHARAIQKATSLPVFDITTLIKLVHDAVDPSDYGKK
jgi:aspartate/glutamate racemase